MQNVVKIAIIFSFIFLSKIVFCQENDDFYKLNQVLEYVDEYYVDSVDMNKTIENVIVATLKELDPHSIYISKENVEKINQSLEGSFDGIGVYYNILEDTVVVISPISGGPSEKVGIKPGDRIVKVEGENIANIGITTKDINDRFLGEKGTIVNISIRRKGISELIDFTITRDVIPIYSIDAAYMVDDEIGYIRLNKFSATSVIEFDSAVEKLKKEGLENLILDLRENGGGYLTTSITLSDEFLKNNELIVFTEGVNSLKKEYFATSEGNFEKGRLAVLIDEGTASASEIVSGAIQDWDRGVIIGRRSYGKGLVQKPYKLNDGSIIRLTIARYYTPTGRLIQKSYEEGTDEYKQDIQNRALHGELLNSDSIHFQDSLKYSTIKNKRTVYAGGGIMPDIFIPLDTTGLPDFYSNLVQDGTLYNFVLKYSIENRDSLISNYPDFKLFLDNFQTNEQFYDKLIAYAKSENTDSFEIKSKMFYDSENIIENQIKAMIARNLWTASEYYQIINQSNKAFLKAIEILKDKNLYENELNN